MDYLQANLTYLETENPELHKALMAHGPSRAVVEPARKCGLSMSFGGEVVHSPYDPVRETAKSITGEPEIAHVHFGLGLGYMLQQDETLEDGGIVVFEPNLDFILAALSHTPLAEELVRKRAKLCHTIVQLKSALAGILKGNRSFKILKLPYHSRNYPTLYETFRQAIETIYNEARTSLSTLKNNAGYMTHSALLNLAHSTVLPGVENLRNLFAGLPAVIVGAGPSLDRNLIELRPYADRCVIIAIARTAQPLENVGIYPHFLVHNEAQPFYHTIEGCGNLADTAFVLSRQAEGLFYSHPHGSTFVYDNPADFVMSWLQESHPNQQHAFLPTGGSVSTEAFSLGYLLGCDPIVLIGQDLALKGQQYYANSESNHAFSHSSAAYREIGGYFGQRVQSLNSYMSYAIWFGDEAHKILQEPDPPRLINATEGGALLKNFEMRKLSEAAWTFFKKPFHVTETVRAAGVADPEKVLSPAELARLLKSCKKRAEQFDELNHSFRPYYKRFVDLLEDPSPANLTRIQHAYDRLDTFKDSYIQLNKGMDVLWGFIQGELSALKAYQDLRAIPTGKDETESLIFEIKDDLECFRRSMDATMKSVVCLRSALAGDPPNFGR